MAQHIIAAIFILLAGGVIGGYIVLMYLDKSMDDLINSCDNRINAQRDIITKQRELIGLYKSTVVKAYIALVGLRDNGTENLDEIIGVLCEVMDDHKEESECSSDQ